LGPPGARPLLLSLLLLFLLCLLLTSLVKTRFLRRRRRGLLLLLYLLYVFVTIPPPPQGGTRERGAWKIEHIGRDPENRGIVHSAAEQYSRDGVLACSKPRDSELTCLSRSLLKPSQ